MMHSYESLNQGSRNLICVLILVLMDDALVHMKRFIKGLILLLVLILVLMDDALVLASLRQYAGKWS